MHVKLTIAYDGTGFVGWQRQPTGTSIQALLEDALAPLDAAPVVVHGAGRTDAGVHACGQVASITLQRTITTDALVRALNFRLPRAVRVLSAEEVAPDFHARFSASRKSYRYRIWNGPVLDPFERDFVWHIPSPALDVAAMADAARHLVGRHDFAAFQGAGGDVETSVRTIYDSTIASSQAPLGGPLLTYEVEGDGFLRHMVRSIVGSLVEVGRGYRSADWLGDVLRSKDRHRAGRTAPATGLFLMSVGYQSPDL
ncbi:MAG: tRNA pseudouridine(38-40) synthase TruA [Vicinamibacterales bacterium]